MTSAIRDAEIADAAAFRDMLLNTLSELNSHSEFAATTRETELINTAAANSDPWTKLGRDKVTAQKNFLVDRHNAEYNYRQTSGNAQVAFTTSESNAWRTRANDETGTLVNLTNDQNTAFTNRLASEHTRFQTGVTLGVAPVETNELDQSITAPSASFASSTSTETITATAVPDASQPNLGEQTEIPPIDSPYEIQPSEAKAKDPSSQEADFENVSNTLNAWDTTDFDTFYSSFLNPDGTLSLYASYLIEGGTNPLDEATDKTTGVAGKVNQLHESDDFLETALAQLPGGNPMYSEGYYYNPDMTRDALQRLLEMQESEKRLKSSPLWEQLRKEESTWDGFNKLSETQKDFITKMHVELSQDLAKLIKQINKQEKQAWNETKISNPTNNEQLEALIVQLGKGIVQLKKRLGDFSGPLQRGSALWLGREILETAEALKLTAEALKLLPELVSAISKAHNEKRALRETPAISDVSSPQSTEKSYVIPRVSPKLVGNRVVDAFRKEYPDLAPTLDYMLANGYTLMPASTDGTPERYRLDRSRNQIVYGATWTKRLSGWPLPGRTQHGEHSIKLQASWIKQAVEEYTSETNGALLEQLKDYLKKYKGRVKYGLPPQTPELPRPGQTPSRWEPQKQGTFEGADSGFVGNS